jgi:hypothetical protein
MRALTDVPTVVAALIRGHLDIGPYRHSLRPFHTEAVFSRDDPIPALAEVALLPYLALRRGF